MKAYEIHIVKHIYHRFEADNPLDAAELAERLESMHDDPGRYEPDSWEYRVLTDELDEDGVPIEEALN